MKIIKLILSMLILLILVLNNPLWADWPDIKQAYPWNRDWIIVIISKFPSDSSNINFVKKFNPINFQREKFGIEKNIEHKPK